MSRRMGVRPAATLIVPALAAAMALAGCAAGTDALTSHARTTTDSVSAAVGTIALRNLYVAGPVSQGDDAQIVSAFFNSGADADQLAAISSPSAAGGKAPADNVIASAGGQIYIANGSAPKLVGVKSNLRVGQAVPVTFTFARAGSVTVLIPVETPPPGASAAPSTTATPSSTESPLVATSAPPSATPSVTATPSATATP